MNPKTIQAAADAMAQTLTTELFWAVRQLHNLRMSGIDEHYDWRAATRAAFAIRCCLNNAPDQQTRQYLIALFKQKMANLR